MQYGRMCYVFFIPGVHEYMPLSRHIFGVLPNIETNSQDSVHAEAGREDAGSHAMC